MTTLVIGANGKIGRILTCGAAEAGVEVRAMVRDPGQRSFFEAASVPVVTGDLTGDFGHALEGCEQVVFTAGSGPKTGYDQTLLVDLWGAIRVVDACLEQGIRHLVMVSALRAEDPLAGPEKLRPYLAAKRAADLYLAGTELTHTILRPGKLTDEPGTGLVRTSLGDRPNAITISRDNVARCILHVLAHPPSVSRTVDLLDGGMPIEEAL